MRSLSDGSPIIQPEPPVAKTMPRDLPDCKTHIAELISFNSQLHIWDSGGVQATIWTGDRAVQWNMPHPSRSCARNWKLSANPKIHRPPGFIQWRFAIFPKRLQHRGDIKIARHETLQVRCCDLADLLCVSGYRTLGSLSRITPAIGSSICSSPGTVVCTATVPCASERNVSPVAVMMMS